jgi:hypothetical protein
MGAELQLARVQLGAVGTALGALTAAMAAGLAAAGAYVARGLKLIIADSEEAQARLKILESDFDALNKTVAETVTVHVDLADALAGTSVLLDEVSGGVREASGGATDLTEALDAMWLGFLAVNPAIALAVAALKALAEIGKNAPPVLRNTTSEVNALADSLRDAADAAGDFFSQLPNKVTGGIGGVGNVIKGWAEAGGAAQLRETERRAARAVEAATRRGGGGGGGKKKREEMAFSPAEVALADAAAAFQPVAPVDAGPLALAEALADLNFQAEAGIRIGTAFTDALGSLDFAAARLADQGMSLLVQTLGEAINLMVDLGSVAATTLGQFAAGVGTLSQFGDTVLDMFGSLASSLGDFYIKTGMASLWLNPAAGAGMIAGGLALKALGGFLGGKGSGNRGAGRSSGGTAAAVDPSRFMRPERDTEPSVTNLKVVILGEEIERPVTRFIDDVARRGGFRNLATRT